MTDAEGGWSVVSSGATKARRHFDDKLAAIKFAQDVTRQQGGIIYIHAKDGTIRNRSRSPANEELEPALHD